MSSLDDLIINIKWLTPCCFAAYAASKYAIEGFSESLAYELGMFGVRVKIVEPGLAPSTSFAANSGGRCDNLIPAAYADYAGRYLKSMQNIPPPIRAQKMSRRLSMQPRLMVSTSCATQLAPIV